MATTSVDIPLNVNVSTADPNEKVRELARIPAYKSSSLLNGASPPDEFDHTANNGIHAESGVTNSYLTTVPTLGGDYNYLTEDGQNIQLVSNGNDSISGAPIRAVYLDGKFIDNVPSHGLASLQAIGGQYDDMIMTDGNPVGMKILANTPGGIQYQTGGTTWTAQTSTAASSGGWQSVTYGNGLFVAVANTNSTIGAIQTSLDGINWTARTSTAASGAYGWHSVCYGNGLFVAVAYTASTTGAIQTSSATVLPNIVSFNLDEISPTGSVANTASYTLSGVGFLKSFCLVRQALGNSFTWASPQYILVANSSSTYNIYSTAGVAQLGTNIPTATWAGSSPQNVWAAKMAGKNEYVICAQGGSPTTNPCATVTTTTTTPYTYSWATMQSKNGYNRIILAGQKNVAATSYYLGISGFSSFTSTYALAPTANAVDSTADVQVSSCYNYVDIGRGTGTFNHYYSSYRDPTASGVLATANGLFQSTTNSQGLLRGVARLSWANTTDYGGSNPFEFRLMMAPLYSATTASNASTAGVGATYLGSQPVGVSVGCNFDGNGNIPMGVPLTNLGEFDLTYSPSLGPNWDKLLWRYGGTYYLAQISTSPIKPIQKISHRLYKINTIGPVNVLDSVTGVLNLGSNDYTGGALTAGGTTSGAFECMVYGNYANSIDYGLQIVPWADATSVTPLAATQPSVYQHEGYWNLTQYGIVSSQFTGNVIQNSSGVAISQSTLTPSAFNAINNNPSYLRNAVIPIPLGLNWSGRQITSNSSATSVAFSETYFTSGYPSGGVVLSSDYDGYILGNIIHANTTTFTIYSTNYVFDGRAIYIANFNAGALTLPLQQGLTADGLQFLAASPSVAYFLSNFDNSIYTFDGGRTLNKSRKFNLFQPITNGSFNVRDSVLTLDSGNNWIFVRDGLVTVNPKNASQLGQTLRIYDTVNGAYIGGDSQLYQYGYSPSQMVIPKNLTGSTSVLPLNLQTAYYGIGSNKVARELDYYVTLYSASKAKTSVLVTVYSFNQDEQKGMVAQNPQPAIVNINPGDYDDGGYFRFSVAPKYSKVLACSISVQCNTKVAVTDIIARFDDEGIDAIYAPNRRAKT